MPTPRRIARLQRVILETAATAVHRDLADPRIGFVTLTRVQLARDLTAATIFWSCLGTEADRRKSARALEDATALVQAVVAGALGTRVTPALRFRYDPSLANAARLEGIFEKLRRERGEVPAPEEAPPAPEGEEGEAADDDVPAEAADEPDGDVPPVDPSAGPSGGKPS